MCVLCGYMLAGSFPSVNIGQSSFEAIAQIVRKVQGIETHKNDRHGRNSLLTTYIQYTCTLPYVDSGQRGRYHYRSVSVKGRWIEYKSMQSLCPVVCIEIMPVLNVTRLKVKHGLNIEEMETMIGLSLVLCTSCLEPTFQRNTVAVSLRK